MGEVAARGILRAAIIALLATGVGFAVEAVQLSGAQRGEGVIVAIQRKPYAVRTGDAYEMVIEYTAGADTRHFAKSRAVWDLWGPMAQTGTRIPILYSGDGRAWVDSFFYVHPFTGAMLVLDVLLGITWLWLAILGNASGESRPMGGSPSIDADQRDSA